jgi:glycosyltransferase involved in cell wall biosynthesis
MKLWLPIERLTARYSDDWYRWFSKEFDARRGWTRVGDARRHQIVIGEFLDVYDTQRYKLDQVRQAVGLIAANQQDECHTVFLMDLWCTALEALLYIRDCARDDIRIVGMLHAGSYDPNDYLYRSGTTPWAKHLEEGWFGEAHRILVATDYHRRLLCSQRGVDSRRVLKVPWPVRQFPRAPRKRERIVVWPHRIAPEKNLVGFADIEAAYRAKYGRSDDRFVVARLACKSKADYYRLLGQSKVVVSTALQETFGIAMQEGINSGCWPCAPLRLSYPETIPARCLYEDIGRAVEIIREGLLSRGLPPGFNRYGPSVKEVVDCIES